MSTTDSVNEILQRIDRACVEWKEKFPSMEIVQNLFGQITRALIDLSISSDDEKQRLAEEIVTKIKQLRDSVGESWPTNIESFGRDRFQADEYRIESAEFFHPVPFYPNDSFILKFYRWSVYDSTGEVIVRYYLEKSELVAGQPYYVLGKSYANGHAQLQAYGTNRPTYFQMKNRVIEDLKGQGPLPFISSTKITTD